MTHVLVDTSALIAFLDADDPRHADVVSAFKALAAHDLVTHGYIVAETIAVTRRRLGTDAVISLLDDVLPAIELVPVDAALHLEAQRRYRASLPSGTSFVDQVSLAVIERDAISTAFTLDPDFATSGVRLVPG